jgi:hypothetical protein
MTTSDGLRGGEMSYGRSLFPIFENSPVFRRPASSEPVIPTLPVVEYDIKDSFLRELCWSVRR